MKTKSFSNYMSCVIRTLKSEERFGTAYIYGYALHSFRDFVGGGEIFFGAINRRTLKRFENHLREKRCSWNTVSTYIRALRAVYNRAVDEGIVKGEYRLFNGVFTGVKSNKKLALSSEKIRSLLEGYATNKIQTRTPLPAEVQQAQDTLALMLLLQGMPFTDLIHLRQEDLRTDEAGNILLSCRRQKTGTELNVLVVAEARMLIDRYRNNAPASPYLLRFLTGNSSGERRFQEYRRLLRRLNHNLSKLPRLLGVGAKVSSYTARHTWATLAKYCGVPEEVISEGLGHSSLEVTRTYLKRFESNTLNKANQLIINYAFNGKREVWRMS